MCKFVEDVKVGNFYFVFRVCKTVKCLHVQVDELVVMMTGHCAVSSQVGRLRRGVEQRQ